MKLSVKRSFILFLCKVLMLSAVPLLRFQVAATQVLVGDVNGSNEINVCDVARLYAHFQGDSLVGQDAMDRADLDNLGWLYPRYTDDLYAQIRGVSPRQLQEAFRQLPENTQMDGVVTLSGKVVAIKDCYNPEYKNISVTIQVEGWQEPVLCYRMTGYRMESIAIGDRITVTGLLCNYRGKAEFSAGCQGVINNGVSTAESYNKAVVDLIYNLPVNASSRSEISLTGRVITMDSVTSDASEITVTIQLSGREDKTIRCSHMVGDDILWVRVGKKITVSGILRNNNGIVEFTPGCQLLDV